MIGYLQGFVRLIGGNTVVITTGGVGYAVRCPSTLPDGCEIELFVTTNVRENDITLFGFRDPAEQILFGALTAINGIGPAAALALLRDVGVDRIVAAVAGGDTRTLTAAAGVGAKAATKIINELNIPDGLIAAVEPLGPVNEDLARTLEQLGYNAADVAIAVAAAVAAHPGDEAAQLAFAFEHLRSEAAA